MQTSRMSQTIDQAVGSVLVELGLTSAHRFLIRNHMINFMIRHRAMVKAVLKVYSLSTIPQSLTIPMPTDYVKFSKVGWVVDGQVKLVAQNFNIAQNTTMNQRGVYTGFPTAVYNNTDGQPVPYAIQGYPYNTVLGPRGGSGKIQGAAIPELNGFFEEDLDNRVIRLSSINRFPNFYMEYESDCFEPTEDYLLHPYVYLAAKAWATYYYTLNNPRATQGIMDRYARELDIALLEMKRNIKDMQVIDYLTSWDKVMGYLD